MQDDLIERLEALHVWPQFVADDHADILSPRQSAGLYEVGNVAHEAASAGRADNARIAALEADNARLMGLVKEAGEALEPFAQNIEYVEFLEAADDDYVERPPFKAGEYRKAAATLAKLQEPSCDGK